MPKCVLIIAYEFYPFNTGGSHRPFRLARFLKQRGYEPIVIAAEDAALRGNYDSSLATTLEHEKIEVVRIATRSRSVLGRLSDTYYFNITDDSWSRWKGQLMPKLEQLLSTKDILCSVVTVPPFSVADIIPFLKGKGMPVILDMRDAWSQWNVSPYASKLHYLLTLRKEREALQNADLILVTSQVTLDDLKRLHGETLGSKLLLVPNSFDELRMTPGPPPGQRVDIGYIGSFYYDPKRDNLNRSPWWKKKPWQWLQYLPHMEEWIYRSPWFFFAALHRLFHQFPEYRQRVMLHVAGIKPAWFDEMVAGFSLGTVVKHYGFLNKKDTDELREKMHYMLVTSAKRHGAKDYSIAGKTYELIACAKPALAFVTEGAQKDILAEAGTALLVDPDDLDSAADLLKRAIDGNIHLSPNLEYIKRYLTQSVFRQLADVLKEWES